MFDFIKIILILAIVVVLIFYFVNQWTDFFGDSPAEDVKKTAQPTDSRRGIYFTWRNFISSPKTTTDSTDSSQASSVTSTIPESQIPHGFTREQLSSYFQKIRISSVSPNRSQSVLYYSTIRFSSRLSGDETMNITGWKIKSNRHEIIIPQAIRNYSPLTWKPEQDIVLSKSNYVYIYSNKSAFGKNLRLNKCIGYLEDTYGFNPSLPQNCPSIPRQEYSYLLGECQSYIRSLRGCELPDVSFYNSLPGTSEGNECRAFLNTISHGSCYKKYRYDSDFLSNEWRVWVDADILGPQHDRVLLYDKDGLLVDEYSY
ncbi:MAG: hypothetical protein V3T98_00535 [Candidatus Paceibacterota bacterium]